MLNDLKIPVSEDAPLDDGRRSLASLITKGILDPILVESGVDDSVKENVLQRFESDLREYLVRF